MKATSVVHVPGDVHHPLTFQQAMDVSNRVHSSPNTSHNTKCRQSTRFDKTEVDYIGNTKDTSIGRIVPSKHLIDTAGRPITTSTADIPTVDISKHVYNLPIMSHEPRHRKSTCSDKKGFDYVETTKDTSPRCVPSFVPAVDVSKHVHNASDDSRNPTLRNSKRSDEIGIGYHGNTKDTSPGCVPSLLVMCRPGSA